MIENNNNNHKKRKLRLDIAGFLRLTLSLPRIIRLPSLTLPQDKPERLKVKVHGRDGFSIGKQDVDLRYIEQLIDSEQTQALGGLLKYAVEKLIDGKRTLPEIVEILCDRLEKEDMSFLAEGYISCGYAVPRRQEIYACFNRYRRP